MSRHTLALILLFAAVVLLFQFRPNGDVDLFCQVRTGQLALERGELIRTDPFTATHAGDPIPTIGWLYQISCAKIHDISGWRLLHQLNALVCAGAFLVAALSVNRRETSVRAGLLAMVLGVLVALSHVEIRPHGFGVLCFAALLSVAGSTLRPWVKLPAALVILVIWQNVHPSVPLGAAIIAAWAGVGWLRKLLDRESPIPWELSLLAIMAAACCLATPMGTGIFARSAYNTQISRELGITEWLPLYSPVVWPLGGAITWAAIGASAALLIKVRRKVRLEDVATLLVFTAGAVLYFRLALFFAVAMVPVWSRWIALAWPSAEEPSDEAQQAVPRWLGGTLVAVAFAVALAVPRVLDRPIFAEQIPLAAVEKLKTLDIDGVVYNYREWSGPLIWAGFPDWKVTIDGRLYIYPREDWRQYDEVAKGKVSVEEVERTYQPEAFFLRPSYHGPFIEKLRASERWREVHEDPSAIIFVRRK